MTSDAKNRDRWGLGRGPLTRWLPVLGQASSAIPELEPIAMRATDSARRLTFRIVVSIKRLTFPAALLAIVHQIGEALVPVVMGVAIDQALGRSDPARLLVWLLVLGVVFMVLSLGFRFAAMLTMRAVQLTQHRLRTRLSADVLHAGKRRVDHTDGAILSTATNDVAGASSAVTIGVFPVGDLAGIGFISTMLFAIHWPLGLAVGIGAPLVVLATGALSAPFARRKRQFHALLAAAVGQAADVTAGYRVIKGIGAEEEAIRRYRRSSQDALSGAHRSVGALGRYLAGSGTISGAFVAIIAGLAGWFALDGQISVGELITVVGLAQVLLTPIFSLTSNTVTWWAGAVASSARLLELLFDAHEPRTETADESDVTLAGMPLVEVVLTEKDTTISILPGELVGVRADDRTALRIVTALLDPRADDDTRVLVDGVGSDRLSQSLYRSRIVVSPHAGTLFSGTIAENLEVPGALSRQRSAMWAAACDDFLGPAHVGEAVQIGENGTRLSGGQRQRVALARALASDAPVLVLHDPTTSVDAVTEARIADRLGRVRQGLSTLVIATSPTLLSACDRVFELALDSDERDAS
ncbi:MAG: ABC transporter transmembrane domain-containing protein [Microbacterium gubbeenense]